MEGIESAIRYLKLYSCFGRKFIPFIRLFRIFFVYFYAGIFNNICNLKYVAEWWNKA